MTDTYTLKVTNCSSQPSLTFAVFTTMQANQDELSGDSNDPFHLAWIVQPINKGNWYTFAWKLNYQIMWSATGFKAGVQWMAGGQIDADPTDREKCYTVLDYQKGDWKLQHKPQDPIPGKLQVEDTASVPPYDKKPSTVALAISAGSGSELRPLPAIGAFAGPKMHQTFTLHPTYFIAAGSYEQGQMVDVSDMTNWHTIAYESGVQDAKVLLDDSNTWRDNQDKCTS